MGVREQKIIEDARNHQPIEELERKFKKAQGRYSKRYWTQEEIDLADARGRDVYEKISKLLS